MATVCLVLRAHRTFGDPECLDQVCRGIYIIHSRHLVLIFKKCSLHAMPPHDQNYGTAIIC